MKKFAAFGLELVWIRIIQIRVIDTKKVNYYKRENYQFKMTDFCQL